MIHLKVSLSTVEKLIVVLEKLPPSISKSIDQCRQSLPHIETPGKIHSGMGNPSQDYITKDNPKARSSINKYKDEGD